MLAGAATALAAARDQDPGTTDLAPVARSSVHSVTNAPEADGASSMAPEPAPRVSADPASTISEGTFWRRPQPSSTTGIPRKAATPPDSPIASPFVKNGPAVAVAVLKTVNPSVPVEGPDLRIGTAGAARDAAGRNGAGPVFQQAGITSYDITLKPGSNLISLTLMPDDTAIESVLAGILDRVETVGQYDTSGPDPKWRSYAPGAPSDLRVMRDGPGYWVHLKDDGTGDAVLTVPGREATGPARRVVQGWNLVGFTATTAGDAATDRAALVALYNATGGANWRNKGNWLSNAPMGEWHGVTTDADGRVTRLSLDSNRLTGEIPAELGNLTSLEVLGLNNNQLTGEIPAELGNLANLTRLYLYRNQLTGEIPAELGNLANLTRLSLHTNRLTGEIPAELGDLSNLTGLGLGNNQLTGSIPAELGDLSSLRSLYLSTNQLTGEIPAELGSLTNLRSLSLHTNQLTGEIPAELGSLTNLEQLWLQYNQLTGEIPAELGDLSNLKVLGLTNNQLTGEIPAKLGNLTNLRELWLFNNQLVGCIPSGLRNIPQNDFAQLGLPFCAMPGAPTVSRVSPTSSSLTLETGASQTFTASATDADSNITSYAWTVNGRGVGNSGTLTLTGAVSQTYSRTFPDTGTYTVKATFTDDEGASGSASWTVGVAAPPQPTSNSAPSVSIASPVSPVRLETGEERTFTARATDDDKNLIKWKWDVDKHGIIPFVDDHQGPEASFASTGRILKSFRHTFPDDGTYTVTVTFTDSSGESDSDEWRVEVEDPPWVDDKSVTHTCGTEPAAPGAGDRFTIVSEVEAGEDLDDVFVRFDFSDPVRGMYDRARGREDPDRDPEGSAYDISEGDTVRFTAPGIVSQEGDGWVLRCTVMREAGFLEGYINNNPRQLAVMEKAVTVGPYTQNPAEKDIGYFKSCGYIATENEGGKLGAKFIRGIRNIHQEYRVNAYLYEGGERVWEGSAHKGAVASTSTQTEFTLTFTGEPELEGKYRLDCELTTKYYFNEPSIAFLLRIPTCVSDPFTFTLCAVVLAYELSTQWELIDSASSPFCVGGPPDCPFTYDTENGISPPSVRVGEPVSLSFRTSGLNGVADHGGVSVSFPDLTGVGTTSADHEYVSDKASVSTASYTTGTSNVTYHRTGASVQTEGGTPGTAEYLLVESDDSEWPSGADRTLELEVTPWEPGTFRVQYRYWLCLAGYDECRRKPESGEPDQQGWQVEVLEITVNAVPDRDELVEFYEDTDGPNWDDDTDWLSHAPLDDWRGVDTADGRVTVLELPSNSLSGAIPPVVGDLTGLEALDLSSNGLTGEIPAALESLTALGTLDLSGNGLRGEIPSDLGDLTALTTLDLSANDLGGGIPSELGKLTNLQVLYLASNNLNRPIPAELGNLTKLTELDLSDNRLSGSIPTELGKLANLQALDLSGNSLRGAIPEGLGRLAKLEAVYLDGNNLNRGCIPATWRDLRNHDLDDVDLPFCDVALSALAVSPGELTPGFDPGVAEYTAQVEEGRVTITPVSAHGATFEFLDGRGESVADADGALGGHQIDVGYGDATTI